MRHGPQLWSAAIALKTREGSWASSQRLSCLFDSAPLVRVKLPFNVDPCKLDSGRR